jgi:hypothetical protein
VQADTRGMAARQMRGIELRIFVVNGVLDLLVRSSFRVRGIRRSIPGENSENRGPSNKESRLEERESLLGNSPRIYRMECLRYTRAFTRDQGTTRSQ